MLCLYAKNAIGSDCFNSTNRSDDYFSNYNVKAYQLLLLGNKLSANYYLSTYVISCILILHKLKQEMKLPRIKTL